MKTVAAMVAIVGLWATTALGGVVQFDQLYVNTDGVPTNAVGVPTGGNSLTTNINLIAAGGTFDNVTALFGSDDAGLIINGAYSTQFDAATAFDTPLGPPNGPTRPGIYPSDLLSGGFLTSAQIATAQNPYLMGTLTLTLPTATAGGYEVGHEFLYFVDSVRDGGFSSIGAGLNSEALGGTGNITVVVPEPASLALLGLGAIGLIRRRRLA